MHFNARGEPVAALVGPEDPAPEMGGGDGEKEREEREWTSGSSLKRTTDNASKHL